MRRGLGHCLVVALALCLFILVRAGSGMSRRELTFRKTHHGPIVGKEDDQHFLSARIAGLFESLMMRQTLKLVRATNLDEFRRGLELQLNAAGMPFEPRRSGPPGS